MVPAIAESEEKPATRRSWFAEIIITPKPGVSDPAGSAVLGGLQSLGYDEVRDVRVGRFVRVEIGAEREDHAFARVVQMCDELLANPVIEEYEITIHDSASQPSLNDPGGRWG